MKELIIIRRGAGVACPHRLGGRGLSRLPQRLKSPGEFGEMVALAKTRARDASKLARVLTQLTREINSPLFQLQVAVSG